ncbi:Protein DETOXIFICATION [Forsythia ovata]|uniref:Protein DETOXIFICATION n=1 Tax=Forsythia ovata TaxID=205694 RepID=A0ABD1QLU0_9LAMI
MGYDYNFFSGLGISYSFEFDTRDKAWERPAWRCHSREHIMVGCGFSSDSFMGFFPESSSEFSLSAFKFLVGFAKLSLASAIMPCYVFGFEIDSVNMELLVSFKEELKPCVFANELGANSPKTAKFSRGRRQWSQSTLFGIFFTVAILAMRSYFPKIFSDKPEVIKETSHLVYYPGSNHPPRQALKQYSMALQAEAHTAVILFIFQIIQSSGWKFPNEVGNTSEQQEYKSDLDLTLSTILRNLPTIAELEVVKPPPTLLIVVYSITNQHDILQFVANL